MGDLIILAALAVIVALAVRSIVKARKKGGCAGCSGGCANCAHKCSQKESPGT